MSADINSLSAKNLIQGCKTLYFAAFLLILLAGESYSAPPFAPPTGRDSFILKQDGKKVGDLSIEITGLNGGYRVNAESSSKMKVLGFSRSAVSKEVYLVDENMSVREFSLRQRIGESIINADGALSGDYYRINAVIDGKSSEKKLKKRGALYPAPLINIVPLLICRGVKECEFQYLDPEALKIKKVTVTFVGEEGTDGEKVLHYRNDLYPVVDNDVWIDLKGRTLKESVRHGLVDTVRAEKLH